MSERDPSQRIVITGMGCVSPLGNDVETSWQRLVNGESAIRNIDDDVLADYKQLGVHVGAPADSFQFEDDKPLYARSRKNQARKMHRNVMFSLYAGAQALRQAGFISSTETDSRYLIDESIVDLRDVAVSIGTGIGGAEKLGEVRTRLNKGSSSKGNPIFHILPERAASVPSMLFGAKGPAQTVIGACATGNMNIIQAAHWLKLGEAKVAIVGGTEAQVTPENIDVFNALGALDKSLNPEEASRPFHVDQRGFVVGEGAGVLVLETLEDANRRNADVLAELISYGHTSDAWDNVFPSGEGAVNALQHVMRRGGIRPGEKIYANAHATGTGGDSLELIAFDQVLNRDDVVGISSIKGATGHLLGASSAFEAVMSVMALRSGIVPPTLKLDNPVAAAKGWHLSPFEATDAGKIDVVINTAFGFGGLNAVIALSKVVNR